jgi:hypothetical protein
MFYVIKKGSKYFKANGYVNSGGSCDTATWVLRAGDSWATSSKEEAEAVAQFHGGKAIPYS